MSNTRQRLISAYQEMHDLTYHICAHECDSPHNCCVEFGCLWALKIAWVRWNVNLEPPGHHPTYLLLGPNGCIAAPHHCPLCTLYYCRSQKKPSGYDDLKRKIESLEDELTRELGECSPPASWRHSSPKP